MNNAKKLFTIVIIGFVMMCSTLYAQVYNRLPDDFEEQYSSLDEYYAEQQEKERAEAALKDTEEEEKAKQEAEMRILRAFFTNDKYGDIIRYVKDFGGYFNIYSNESYDEVYIVWCKSEDNEYSYTIWQLSMQNKKCILMNAYLDDVTEVYHNIATFTGDYDDFVTMFTAFILYSDDELLDE